LLQKDVHFKDLGLLVIDEEHRFGVKHKEQIKRLTQHVDALTLTATPIPRSLHMALVGLRDCSIIATPPEGRSAIETRVTPFHEEAIQQAITQELERGGQVFFVHNRIETLASMQRLIERLVPACRVGIAHGQMPAHSLEKLMLRFLRREFDLLLCTTIIESGLDIPSVNTIIINHAETFGLAQLYQLRGRVGRSTQQAYAYLLIPGDLLLSDVARKRIEVIEEFSELGSGFHLASRDLEIRGAGNLLGPQQSGHIASVGFDLYCQMMSEAIQTVRGEEVRLQVEPELRLTVQGYLPEAYIDNDAQRLELYRRLSATMAPAALDALRREIQDRFGPLPEAAGRLFTVLELKILARHLALERIEQRDADVLLTFHPLTPVDPSQLLPWLQSSAPGFRLSSEHVVCIPWPSALPTTPLLWLKERLQQLQEGVKIPLDSPTIS
jgi:transcription-repair coupling factor (superfamily II helicase)